MFLNCNKNIIKRFFYIYDINKSTRTTQVQSDMESVPDPQIYNHHMYTLHNKPLLV